MEFELFILYIYILFLISICLVILYYECVTFSVIIHSNSYFSVYLFSLFSIAVFIALCTDCIPGPTLGSGSLVLLLTACPGFSFRPYHQLLRTLHTLTYTVFYWPPSSWFILSLKIHRYTDISALVICVFDVYIQRGFYFHYSLSLLY